MLKIFLKIIVVGVKLERIPGAWQDLKHWKKPKSRLKSVPLRHYVFKILMFNLYRRCNVQVYRQQSEWDQTLKLMAEMGYNRIVITKKV